MNAKLREGGKKEEKRRLKEFVENAYRCDPRVIAYKEAQRAERCAQCACHIPFLGFMVTNMLLSKDNVWFFTILVLGVWKVSLIYREQGE